MILQVTLYHKSNYIWKRIAILWYDLNFISFLLLHEEVNNTRNMVQQLKRKLRFGSWQINKDHVTDTWQGYCLGEQFMGFCWPSLYTTSDDIALCFSNWGWLIQMVAITAETHVDMIRSQFGKVIIENVGFNIKSNWERQFYYDRPKITFSSHIIPNIW